MKDKTKIIKDNYRECYKVEVKISEEEEYSIFVAKENVNTFNNSLFAMEKLGKTKVLRQFLFRVESAFASYNDEYMFSKKTILEAFKQIAKEVGVYLKGEEK